MQRTHSAATIAAVLALACAAPWAAAQTAPPPQHPQSGAITHTPPFQSPLRQQAPPPVPPASSPAASRDTAMRQHAMTGTVTSVSSSDIVGLKTDDGMLKLHFPQAHERLQKGDRITVHLGYTIDSHANPGSGTGQ